MRMICRCSLVGVSASPTSVNVESCPKPSNCGHTLPTAYSIHRHASGTSSGDTICIGGFTLAAHVKDALRFFSDTGSSDSSGQLLYACWMCECGTDAFTLHQYQMDLLTKCAFGKQSMWKKYTESTNGGLRASCTQIPQTNALFAHTYETNPIT